MPANLETLQWPQNWKRSAFIPIRKKGNVKECSNYCTVALISGTSKVMLKILQARLQQYVPRTHRCSSWILKRQRKQRSNCQYPLDHRKSNRILKNLLLLWLHQSLWLCSVQFSRSVVSDSLWLHDSQHSRPPCPSPTSKFTQTHIHQVSDAIQPSHAQSSPSLPAPNPSQHQNLFQWVNSSHEVAKVLEFQL